MNAHEREALRFQISELVDASEPEAVLATLHRIAERMAQRAIRLGKQDDCARWLRLERALSAVQRQLVEALD
jgi:hypothetical protein